jgi:hypothetical protein
VALYIKGVNCSNSCGSDPCTGGAPCSVPVVNSSASYTACVGDYFYYQITATNSPTTYGASSIPPGTSFDPTTGIISGTLTASTTTAMVVSASNSCGASTGYSVAMTINSTACSGVSIYGGQDPCGPMSATCVDSTYGVTGLFACTKSVRVVAYAASPLSIAFTLYADTTSILSVACNWPFSMDTYVSVPAGTSNLRVVAIGDCDNSNLYGPFTFSITCS